MRNERIFYLDFIRAIATISIILTHFNAVYLYLSPPMPEKAVITTVVANIYIGDFGVSLFFIISGAALMYVYQEKSDLKEYFKKRFLSIYPMFWLAYIVVFVFYIITNVPILSQAPLWKMIFTIIGFDGYLMDTTSTFYILGEWFLGCIILMYIIFPILKKCVLNYPKLTAFLVVFMSVLSIYFNPTSFQTVKILFVRLPEFALGMYFICYIKKVKLPLFFVSLIIIILNTIISPQINTSVQTTYIGTFSFFILVFLSQYIQSLKIRKICSIISKYSYAVFLVHHVIIAKITSYFNLLTISIKESYILFFICCCVIFVCAYILEFINDFFINKKLHLNNL